MYLSQNPFDIFFVAVGAIFTLLAVWIAYKSPDPGTRQLRDAQENWDREANAIERLEAQHAQLRAEYGQTWVKHKAEAVQIQKQGLELMEIYAESLSQHSRLGRIEMLLPLTDLPPAFDASEPPPPKFSNEEVKKP